MSVRGGIRFPVFGGVLAATPAEDTSVGQQDRRGMVAAINLLGSQLRPDSGGGIPKFGRMDRLSMVEVVEVGALGPARDQDGAVRQERGVVLTPTKLHRGSDGP